MEIGKEYIVEKVDFLTQLPFVIDTVIYMGKHPYDSKHILPVRMAALFMFQKAAKY